MEYFQVSLLNESLVDEWNRLRQVEWETCGTITFHIAHFLESQNRYFSTILSYKKESTLEEMVEDGSFGVRFGSIG